MKPQVSTDKTGLCNGSPISPISPISPEGGGWVLTVGPPWGASARHHHLFFLLESSHLLSCQTFSRMGASWAHLGGVFGVNASDLLGGWDTHRTDHHRLPTSDWRHDETTPPTSPTANTDPTHPTGDMMNETPTLPPMLVRSNAQALLGRALQATSWLSTLAASKGITLVAEPTGTPLHLYTTVAAEASHAGAARTLEAYLRGEDEATITAADAMKAADHLNKVREENVTIAGILQDNPPSKSRRACGGWSDYGR